MGFESFQVVLRGGTAPAREVAETLRGLPHLKLDEQSHPLPGPTYYLRADGQHVIEIELDDCSPVRVSCRFTLCHPPSVDAAFLALIRELMACFGMEATICDDVRPEHAHSFSLANYAELEAATLGYIAARRVEWVAVFGGQQLPATTSEVYGQIILPQCQLVR